MEFDWFIDTVPEVIERVRQAKKRGESKGKAEGLIKGKEEGKLEGELQALRLIVLDTIQDRFPDLTDFAQFQATLIKQPTLLRKLIRDLQHASDETTAVHLLTANGRGI